MVSIYLIFLVWTLMFFSVKFFVYSSPGSHPFQINFSGRICNPKFLKKIYFFNFYWVEFYSFILRLRNDLYSHTSNIKMLRLALE